MKNLVLLQYILLFAINSCQKEIKSEKGGIDLFSNVYFDASKGLKNIQSFHLSSLNYSGDSIIERIPNIDAPGISRKIYFITDSLCFNIENHNSRQVILSEIIEQQTPILVEEKKEGTLFSQEKIPNYKNRKNLSDTVLFKKKYKRFEINSPWMYTRFYILLRTPFCLIPFISTQK